MPEKMKGFDGDARIYRRINGTAIGDMNHFEMSGYVWQLPMIYEGDRGKYLHLKIACRTITPANPPYRMHSKQYTNWVYALCWGRLAEAVVRDIEQGDYIIIQGHYQCSRWHKHDRWHYRTTPIVAWFKRVTRKADRQPVEVDVEGVAYEDTLRNSDLDQGFGYEF